MVLSSTQGCTARVMYKDAYQLTPTSHVCPLYQPAVMLCIFFFLPNQQYLLKIQLNALEKADQYIDESSPSEDYTERKINCYALERKATFI